jgi:anti-sigma-K factor RskA
MSYDDDEDQDALAAEYVLGTLDANERAQAQALIGLDPGFAALVRTWERRLGELNVMVEPVEPPAETWASIKTRVAGGTPVRAAAPLPPPPAQPAPPPPVAPAAQAAPMGPTATTAPAAPVAPPIPPAPAAPPASVEPAAPPSEPSLPFAPQLEPPAHFRPAPIVDFGQGVPPEPAVPGERGQRVAPEVKVDPFAKFDPFPDLKVEPPHEAVIPAEPPSPAEPVTAAEPTAAAAPGERVPEPEFPGLAELVAERQKAQQPEPEEMAPQAPAADVLIFRRRARRWRAFAGLTTAMAACLAGYMVVWAYAPERLPPKLRLPNMVQIQVVEKEIQLPPPPAPPPQATPARFVAVLQREPSAPAFLLTVDTQNRTLTVRRVAAGQEPGKSYELWLVSNRLPGPRSLGVVGSDEFTRRPLAETFAPDVVNTATYAVSLEPEGGSPTGSPTGPVLFTGKLVESLPAQPAAKP